MRTDFVMRSRLGSVWHREVDSLRRSAGPFAGVTPALSPRIVRAPPVLAAETRRGHPRDRPSWVPRPYLIGGPVALTSLRASAASEGEARTMRGLSAGTFARQTRHAGPARHTRAARHGRPARQILQASRADRPHVISSVHRSRLRAAVRGSRRTLSPFCQRMRFRFDKTSTVSVAVAVSLVGCAGNTSTHSPGDRRAYAPNAALESRSVVASSNPIIANGVDYTTDPAPLVAGGALYIITGRDTARQGVNDFMMPEWQMLETRSDPMAGKWTHYPHFLKPDAVFKWATPGRAYAAQIVQGGDGKFYLYAPVVQAVTTNKDKFAIGVAVSNSPTGPWVDAHPAGPIVSQSYPMANTIQNIDPTVMVDDDKRAYLYWGTFGKLKGVELDADMVTFKGAPVDVTTLTGFFEASWLFKRRGTYYMAYAANNAGPNSACTEAVYYACIAYGTAPSPLGPWTYRGVILDPVSSTTSHPGIIAYKGAWYITYHTADAKDGGHFRRSVAIDRVSWDDNVSPARIRKIVQTGGAPFDATPIANIASHARITASNVPVPPQYWLRALNDGKTRVAPLPPDMWATWTPNNPPSQWVLYEWSAPVTLNASSVYFWGDHAAGSGIGVAPPKSWHLEYRDGNVWKTVSATTPYTSTANTFNRVTFDAVTTRCLRAVFDAATDGKTFAAVAAQEWQAFSPDVQAPLRQGRKELASATCD